MCRYQLHAKEPSADNAGGFFSDPQDIPSKLF
jgi:hypothetical protein